MNDTTQTPVPTYDGFFTSTDGHQLYYRVMGNSGKTVVVLHGGPGLHMNYFAADMEPLARTHPLIFYDQRSCGRSELIRDSARLTADYQVEDLEALRQHFKIDQLILLGHSWGSGLAVLYAMKYPHQLECLFLVDSMPPRAEPYMAIFGENIMARIDPAKKDRFDQISNGELTNSENDQIALLREYWEILLPSYLYDPTSITQFRGDINDAPAETLLHFEVVFNAVFESIGNFDWREALAEIETPSFVIHGIHDPIPLESAREWAEALPNSRMLEIDRCGHFPFTEQPAQFFPAIEAFLQEL